ncbi:MAG: MopE-related protein, partial [Myxococcota bacterium]
NADDCDDDELTINPEGAEFCGDGIDNDCDGNIDAADDDSIPVDWYIDNDDDGFGDRTNRIGPLCEGPEDYAPNPDDCDDTDGSINPEATENWYDGIDQDCANDNDFDADADGFDAADHSGDDCEDEDPGINPGIIEVCGDALDNNCDELIDPCEINRTISGENDGEEAGYAVVVDDINGDGEVDLVLGAPYADTNEIGAGGVYLVNGPITADVTLSETGRWDGDEIGGAAGWSLTTSPDFDGDGNLDLLVGAYRVDGSEVSELGKVYLLSGPITTGGDLEDAELSFLGEEAGDAAGWQLDGQGDLNGDGDSDLLISAIDGSSGAGVVYALFGPSSVGGRLFKHDVKITGEDANDEAGLDMSFVGDIDGDGVDDMAIGAPNHSEGDFEGAVYVIYGSDTLSRDISLADADGIRIGEDGGDEAGTSVAAVGDVDGDGKLDVFIGAPGYDGDASETGAAYVLLGPVSGSAELADAHARLDGIGEDSRAGSAVERAGDINNDGEIDLLVGAPGFDAEDSGAGAAYLIHGPVSGSLTLKVADGVLIGDDTGMAMGSTLLGDVELNGDGVDDVIISAPILGSGETYILFGGGW